VEFDAVLNEIRKRDRIDSSRSVAPLKRAPDAVLIDSSHLSIEQVIEQIIRLAHGEMAKQDG
jgi:cytidylate kinase